MNPLQQAAFRRKLYYFGAILALFTVSIVWRGGLIGVPLSGSARPATWLASHTILDQSRHLELRELDEGDPEVAGSAIRLSLVGSRGLVITALWQAAIEKQKRNDFHEFELLVRTVTKLQPHFITPWIFQSWNIAYNVSVEMHSIGDMYFYIARGIELLAEGERRNKRSPDMRYQIAFYYLNKFGVSDQVQTLRCLFQLSCIPPAERDPVLFQDETDPDGVNRAAFLKFCQDHPHLVRRLRGEERREQEKSKFGESLQCRTPRDVIQFIKENKSVPSRYANATDLAPPERQFPALPEKFNEGPDEAHPGSPFSELGDGFSGFLAARAWYTYSLVLLPPPPTFPEAEGGGGRPSAAPRPGPPGTTNPDEYDPFKYRVPRMPMLIIFRQGAPRAQTYQAETEQKDGWFDGTGWVVDEWVDLTNAWFTEPLKDAQGREVGRKKAVVVLGRGVEWSGDAWRRAYSMWSKHGRENGLELSPSRLVALKEDSLDPGTLPSDPSPEQMADPVLNRQYRATWTLVYYNQNRAVTNFPFYLANAEAESQEATVQARKTLWQADQARRVGNRQVAIDLYRKGLDQWREVLLRNPTYHRPEKLDKAEEETALFELAYLRLIAQDDPRVWAKAREDYAKEYTRAAGAVIPFLHPGPSSLEIPAGIRDNLHIEAAEKYFAPFGGTMTTSDDRNGTPWVRDHVRDGVLQREGVIRQPTDAQPAPGMPGDPIPGAGTARPGGQ